MKKRDDKSMWYVILLCCAVMSWPAYFILANIPKPKPEPQEPALPSLMDIQRRVGAEPDGIPGPDTMAKWDYAYANQEANQFMTPSGGK